MTLKRTSGERRLTLDADRLVGGGVSVPAPTGGDYPTETDLEYIATWPLDDPLGWFRFVHGAWWAADWGWHEEPATDDFNRAVRRFSISTGGWSGNEDLIEAMSRSFLWHVTWVSSRRGGHYVFEVTACTHAA